MTSKRIALRRLFSQQMINSGFTDPAALVKWMGCVRAEDFSAAKWAIGQRVGGSTDTSIERAFNQGLILRTHVLQPVKHFISPDDIHWMLALTSPRLKAINKGLYHSLSIDDPLLKKSKRVMARALEQGHMTRLQLSEALKMNDMHIDDLRLGLLLMDAELDGLICGGGKEAGGQFTYTLLKERAPVLRHYNRAEAVAELARRYFVSRGPATVYDFRVWSGLGSAEVKTGLEMNKPWLGSEVVHGQVYYFDGSEQLAPPARWGHSGGVSGERPSVFLLPACDEVAVAYAGNAIFKPAIIIDGHASGNWTKIIGKDTVSIKVSTPAKQSKTLQAAIRQAAGRYSVFINKKLMM